MVQLNHKKFEFQEKINTLTGSYGNPILPRKASKGEQTTGPKGSKLALDYHGAPDPKF
jgi:hypothetical protein